MNSSPLQIRQLGHGGHGHDEYQNLIRFNQELQDKIDQLENDIDKFRSRNNNVDLEKVLTHSLTHFYSLTYSLTSTHSLTHSLLLTYSLLLTHSLTHSLTSTHSLTYSPYFYLGNGGFASSE